MTPTLPSPSAQSAASAHPPAALPPPPTPHTPSPDKKELPSKSLPSPAAETPPPEPPPRKPQESCRQSPAAPTPDEQRMPESWPHPSPDPATNPRAPPTDLRHTRSFACSTRRNRQAKPLAPIPSPRPQNKFRQKSVGYPLHTPSAARSPIAPRNNPPPAIPAPRLQSVPAAPEYREPPPTESVDS